MSTDESNEVTGEAEANASENAPSSKLTCATYRDFWIAGHRGDFLQKHIDQCFSCRAILVGDGTLFTTSLDEEADALMARHDSRRRFLVAAAAGLLVLGIGGWSFRKLTATKVNPTGPLSTPATVMNDSRMDALWSQGGDASIRALLSSGTEDEVRRIYRWIAARSKSSLYADMVNGLGDSRIAVVRFALAQLWTVPPIALKPHLALMTSINAAQSNPKLKSETSDLIVIITKS